MAVCAMNKSMMYSSVKTMPAPHRYRISPLTTALSVRESLVIIYTFLLVFSVHDHTFFFCCEHETRQVWPSYASSMHVCPCALAHKTDTNNKWNHLSKLLYKMALQFH